MSKSPAKKAVGAKNLLDIIKSVSWTKFIGAVKRVASLVLLVGLVVFCWSLASYFGSDERRYMKSGISALQAGDFPTAIESFERARQETPYSPAILYDLAIAEANIPGRELRAICWLKEVVVLNPKWGKSADAQFLIAQLQLKAEDRAYDLISKDCTIAGFFPEGRADVQNEILPLRQMVALLAMHSSTLPTLDDKSDRRDFCNKITQYVDKTLGDDLFTNYSNDLVSAAVFQNRSDDNSGRAFCVLVDKTQQWVQALASVKANVFQ